MLISTKLQTIFLHNPKCAGSSIADTLLRHPKWGFKRSWKLYRTCRKDQHSIIIPRPCLNYYVFTTCRNPYDRIVSAYSWLIEYKKWNVSFDQYIMENLTGQGWMRTQDQYTRQAQVVIRYEDMAAGLNQLPFDLGELPEINKTSTRPHWSTYLESNRVLHKIHQLYGNDFISLGYDKWQSTG